MTCKHQHLRLSLTGAGLLAAEKRRAKQRYGYALTAKGLSIAKRNSGMLPVGAELLTGDTCAKSHSSRKGALVELLPTSLVPNFQPVHPRFNP